MTALAHHRIFLSVLLLVLQWSMLPKCGPGALLATACCCSAESGSGSASVAVPDASPSRPSCCHSGLQSRGEGDSASRDLDDDQDPDDPPCPCFSTSDLLLSQDHVAELSEPSNPQAPTDPSIRLEPGVQAEAKRARDARSGLALVGRGRRLHLLHQVFLI